MNIQKATAADYEWITDAFNRKFGINMTVDEVAQEMDRACRGIGARTVFRVNGNGKPPTCRRMNADRSAH